MAVHVAILLKPYLRLILDGRKTIESRLTRGPLPPFRRIAPGERIYFKQSSGPFTAAAVAARIEFHDNLTPTKIASLKTRHNQHILGDESYWQWKRQSRYATLVWLREVEPIDADAGPTIAPSRGPAWFVLADDAAPRPKAPAGFELTITGGMLRNGYVRVPKRVHEFSSDAYGGATKADAARGLQLLLPGGDVVQTDLDPRSMFRWRGWREHFRDHQAVAGDRLRFVRLGPSRYRVAFAQRDAEPRAIHDAKK